MKFLGIEHNLETCIKCNGKIWEILAKKIPLPNFSSGYQLDASLGGIRCPSCIIENSIVTNINPGSLAFLYSRQKNEQYNSLVKPTG